MLNVIFHNLPWVFTETDSLYFEKVHMLTLFETLGILLRCPPTVPQLIIINDVKNYQIGYKGSNEIAATPAPVKVIVEWTGISLGSDTKSGIAHAIHAFLKAYNFQKNVLIVFEQIHQNNVFVEKNGNIVPAPQLPNTLLDFRGFIVR